MKKIVSLFQRNYEGDHLVRDEIVVGAEWVIAGEGTPTRKWDGTCALWREARLYRRFDAKNGKAPPTGWKAAQDPDPITGHWPGWLPVGNHNEDRWFREGLANASELDLVEGWTYELCGPKIGGNPEHLSQHRLIPHGKEVLDTSARLFEDVRTFFEAHPIEGIVWWRDLKNADCDKVKIKARDFGIKWNPRR